MDGVIFAALAAMLLTGLAGSLHCIGMCGPILIGFSQAFRAAGPGGAPQSAMRSDFFWYHLGRLWTYSMLGFLAGLAGEAVRRGAVGFGWQRPVAIGLGVVVLVMGVLMSGCVPRLRLDRLASGCGFKQLNVRPWLGGLLKHRGATARLILGAVMGLLPCGLIYAALIMATAMPTPAYAALSMLVFGLGTLPALSATLVAWRIVPIQWRSVGMKLAAAIVICTGFWMTWRAANGYQLPCCESPGPVAQTNDGSLVRSEPGER